MLNSQFVIDLMQTSAVMILAVAVNKLSNDRDLLLSHVHRLVFKEKRARQIVANAKEDK